MEKPLKIKAVCGWAVPREWFRDQIISWFPDSEVEVIYPTLPHDADEAKKLLEARPPDLFIGYSMGSLWLMKHRKHLPNKAKRALLAPILAFPRERGMGGKTSQIQLNYLIKVLKKNPKSHSPLLDFYSNCRIPFSEPFLQQVPARGVLIAGLEFLLSAGVSAESAGSFVAVLGGNDPFIDKRELKILIPHLEIIADAGHAPDKLLERLANHFQSK